MKVLYFDCASGISGNMTLGALLEIAGNKEYLLAQLATLKIEGYKIEITKKIKNGITGTYVDVILEKENLQNHHIQKQHSHMHRNLKDIDTIIENSQIETKSKELAKRIFLRVAKAESKVHNKPIEEVHFHEVGAIDSIIDIVGTAILINQIHPDKIISSVVNDGYGFIECAHGKMSVPVPATSEIFASAGVKFRQIQIDTELVTPTGAAIIAELATQFTWLPTMEVKKIGWGVGSKELNIPNVLKIYSGEIEEVSEEEVVVLQANIDDCTGEILGYTSELLFQKGALDVFYTPIYMKKNRPAYTLTVIGRKQDKEELQDIIFQETTTLGIRCRIEERSILKRENIEIPTKYGLLEAKKVIHHGKEYMYPEYESLKKLARENNIPLKELYGIEKQK